MRFELSVALKYLIPRWRQLSVSIISLVSILVISLVVWLVVVFLSVTEGIERKWIEELVALNAPLKMVPTDAYYHSYYYQIDHLSYDSNYSSKTIGEKLRSPVTDPYDPTFDAEIPPGFPEPLRNPDGSVKDLAKEAWNSVLSLNRFPGIRPHEFEVSLGNLHLNILHHDDQETKQTVLSQVSYISSHDSNNQRFSRMILPPSSEDFNHLFSLLNEPQWLDERNQDNCLAPLVQNVSIDSFRTSISGFRIPRSLFPKEGMVKGCGIISDEKVIKVLIPDNEKKIESLQAELAAFGHNVCIGDLSFKDGEPSFVAGTQSFHRLQLFLDGGVFLKGRFVEDSFPNAQVELQGQVQGVTFKGTSGFTNLEIASAVAKPHPTDSGIPSPLWVHESSEQGSIIPTGNFLGDGILIAKQYRDNGVHIGDKGYLSYYSPTPSSMQEQRIPVYVAGFYDPGFLPVGNKVVLVDPSITATLRGSALVSDAMLGNGVQLWLPRIEDAELAKVELQKALEDRGLGKFWRVESYKDYDFAQPVLQQLQSDKTLFTLIAIIILLVACSNVISMLILLVNDKKKEIGILQSMGASAVRIASIFGLCGLVTGLISSILGTLVAVFTLQNLQSLVRFLNFLQGHETFQAAFYGSVLPNELSVDALVFVLISTVCISCLAGLVPAVKAARIRPSEILRAE